MTTTGNDGEQSVLAGIRVLDLSGLAGQYTGRLLADLGADVIKIEPPGGDPVRSMPPFADDQSGPDRGLRWLAYNSNKSSIVLDLTSAEGHDRLLEMARSADVMLDSYEPGYLASIGLSDEALRAANPRLITVSVTLFGESGPYGSYSGSDLHAMALSGLMTIQGDNEQPPTTAPLDQAYILTCLHAAHGVFYALMARRKTGRGQHVEVSMHEVLANVFFQIIRYSATSEIGERIGAGGNIAPYNIFKCKDGWVSLAVLTPPAGKSLLRLGGRTRATGRVLAAHRGAAGGEHAVHRFSRRAVHRAVHSGRFRGTGAGAPPPRRPRQSPGRFRRQSPVRGTRLLHDG